MQTRVSTPSSQKHLPDAEAGYSPGGPGDILAIATGQRYISHAGMVSRRRVSAGTDSAESFYCLFPQPLAPFHTHSPPSRI